MKDQRPPFLNSQTLKVLVKPAGPHHRDKRSGWLNAAKTSSAVAGISREVLNVVISFFVSARFVTYGTASRRAALAYLTPPRWTPSGYAILLRLDHCLDNISCLSRSIPARGRHPSIDKPIFPKQFESRPEATRLYHSISRPQKFGLRFPTLN